MSTRFQSSLDGQGYFKTAERFRLKIPQWGFGSFSVRNGLHQSSVTSDLAGSLTWATPETAFVPGPAACALADRLRARRSRRHDA